MSPIFLLPPELRKKIYSYCCASDLRNLALCNWEHNLELKSILWDTIAIPWRSLLKEDSTFFTDEKKLENFSNTKMIRLIYDEHWFGDSKKILHANYKKIVTHCNPEILQTLYMHGYHIDGPCIELTCNHLSMLKKITIIDTNIPADTFLEIGKLEHLSELDLYLSKIDDDNLMTICQKLKKLKLLNISYSAVTDVGLCLIIHLDCLETLNMSGCDISDIALTYVGSLSQLHRLDISSCYEITDEGISHLSNIASLKSLSLKRCKVTDKSMQYIAAMSSLQILAIGGIRITDEGLRELSGLQSLVDLDIKEISEITDAGMSFLSTLASLRKLDVSCTKLGDEGMQAIKRLELHTLDVNFTRVSDIGLEYLSSMATLKKLRCSNTEITDAGILSLTVLNNLKRLDINYCAKVTDVALSHLCKMRALEFIDQR